jgi:hypothetical protein
MDCVLKYVSLQVYFWMIQYNLIIFVNTGAFVQIILNWTCISTFYLAYFYEVNH